MRGTKDQTATAGEARNVGRWWLMPFLGRHTKVIAEWQRDEEVDRDLSNARRFHLIYIYFMRNDYLVKYKHGY